MSLRDRIEVIDFSLAEKSYLLFRERQAGAGTDFIKWCISGREEKKKKLRLVCVNTSASWLCGLTMSAAVAVQIEEGVEI